jgi:hypothetical protein
MRRVKPLVTATALFAVDHIRLSQHAAAISASTADTSYSMLRESLVVSIFGALLLLLICPAGSLVDGVAGRK